MSFICWFRVIRVLFCVSWIFIAEEVDRVTYKGSGDTTTFDVQTLFEAFLNMSLRCACFIDALFPWNKQNFHSWDYAPQVPDYHNS
jgi:hypothetical protein